MGAPRFIFSLLCVFAATSSWAVEVPIIHIRVDGIKITSRIDVPDGDYDLSADVGPDGITGFRFHGTDARGGRQDLTLSLSELRGREKSFAQTMLPGEPWSFTIRVDPTFDGKRGGKFRLHTLSDWKWMVFKSYGYKDFDVLVDVEAGAVRASLMKGNKVEKFSKLTIDVGLIGASTKTE